jgi:rhamnosyltransferase
VTAVIVSYRPDPASLAALLTALDGQVAHIFLVDNSDASNLDAESAVAAATPAHSEVSLCRLGHNLGLGAALNRGIADAIAAGSSHVLLSDQDSLPAPDMVSQLLGSLEELEAAGARVGAVAPVPIDCFTGEAWPFKVQRPEKVFYSDARPSAAQPFVEALTLITSGSLIPTPVLEAVGPMREDFFIDHIDIEWCHRARASGFRLFGSGRACMQQRMGERSLRIWCLGWHRESAYSPERVYYRVRNYLALCRLDYIDWRWKLRSALFTLKTVYANLFFNPEVRFSACLKQTLRGIWHGLRGRFGAA